MSIWELRQLIEMRTPWWVIPLAVIAAALVAGWVQFRTRKL